MNKLLYCFLKDIKLSVKGLYFYIELGMAVIFILVLLFAVSNNSDSSTKMAAFIDIEEMGDQDIASDLEEHGIDLKLLGSRQEVVDELEENRGTVGLVISVEEGKPVFEYILQGYENEKLRNIIETTIMAGLTTEIPGLDAKIPVTTLNENLERLSNRANILPIFFTMNAAFMGLFIIAAYIFLDKDEGTIKALAVTPAKVWHYLLSKVLIMLITGLITSLLVAVAIVGSDINYPLFILAISVYNIFGSALGLFIASFFDALTKAMGWLYLSVVMLGFAGVSYFVPAFSPAIIRILPSYPMLFSFREILLKNGDTEYVLLTVAGFAIAGIVVFILANMRFKKTITV